MNAASRGAPAGGPAQVQAARRSSRGLLFAIAFTALCVATWVAIHQQPVGVPPDQLGPADFAWWLQPVERDAGRRLARVDVDFNAVFTRAGTGLVWAVGGGGLILHSKDAGRTWKRQRLASLAENEPSAKAPPRTSESGFSPDAAFQSKCSGCHSIGRGTDLGPDLKGVTERRERSWLHSFIRSSQNVIRSGDPEARSLFRQYKQVMPDHSFTDAEIDSLLAFIQAGGPRTSPTLNEVAASNLFSIYFADDRNGWVSGERGALFSTADGGDHWLRATPPTELSASAPTFRSIYFADRDSGWLVCEGCGIFHTPDGGLHWRKLAVGPKSEAFTSIAGGPRAGVAIAVGKGVAIIIDPKGSRGIQEWEQVKAAPESALAAVACSGERAWAVGEGGVIVELDVRGQARELAGPRESLSGVQLLDQESGWIVGDHGLVLRTHAGVARLVASRIAEGAELRSVAFSSGRTGYVAGARGNLLTTRDGGATWRQIVTGLQGRPRGPTSNSGWHRLWPAPWYWASLLPLLALLASVLRRPLPQVAPEASVADLLSSDRPLENGSHDAFGMARVALGLSRFLRNANTEPPLTIAVTGEWGSGKSSLMNLLRGDLERRGFRPVWFNAWHHQKEEHLLAALLENVRAQAIPPAWHWEALAFRARLLRIRWQRRRPLVAFLLLLFSFLGGYLLHNPLQLEDVRAAAAAFFSAKDQETGPSTPPAQSPVGAPGGSAQQPASRATSNFRILVFLVTGVGLLRGAWRGAKAFGVNPASLLAHAAGRSRVRDLEAQTGFRHRFAAEFRDVTRALRPRTMVILIDDLDRCRPEAVLEVLEAVNFLVSSGDCFVVLGMAHDRVVRCVGLGFKDVADEFLPLEPGTEAALEAAGDARRRREEFARQYLEKLINLEVPVPVPTGDQSRRVMLAGTVPELGPARPRPFVLAALGRMAPITAGALLMLVAFWLGARRVPADLATALAPKGNPVSSSPALQPESPPRGLLGDAVPPRTAAHLFEGEAARGPSDSSVVLLLVALAVLGGWRLAIRPELVVPDSREFAAALAAWHPLIFERRNTPRAVKRFLNRVRYLAMLQSRWRVEPSSLERWSRHARQALSWLVDERAADPPVPPEEEGPRLPERILVGLAAIEFSYPQRLREDLLDPLRFLRERGGEGWLGEILRENPRSLEELTASLGDYRSLVESGLR